MNDEAAANKGGLGLPDVFSPKCTKFLLLSKRTTWLPEGSPVKILRAAFHGF